MAVIRAYSDGELKTLRSLYGGKDVIVWVYTKPHDTEPKLWAIPSSVAPALTFRDNHSYKLAGALSLLTGRIDPIGASERQREASTPHDEASASAAERRAAAFIVGMVNLCKALFKILLFTIVAIIAVAELASGGRNSR